MTHFLVWWYLDARLQTVFLYTGFHNVILLCAVTHDGKGVVFSQITHNGRLEEMASHIHSATQPTFMTPKSKWVTSLVVRNMQITGVLTPNIQLSGE